MPTSATPSSYLEAWLPGRDGLQFYTRTYPATFPKAVVLFHHGFAEHCARYEHVHARYPANHITVFAYDGRGFGRTALDPAHKSPYGKTSWQHQLADLEFWAQHLAKEYPNTPLFLMGHSMGGGLVLAFFTRPAAPPAPETVKLFSGVIASSPFIQLTHPKPKLLRWAGNKLTHVVPWLLFPADVGYQNLSRDPAAHEAFLKDPYVKKHGSVKHLDDMLCGGDKLVAEDWKRWPKELPVLFIHGTADQVTNPKATETFCKKIVASDKKISLYEGGYHELVNDIDPMPDRIFNECVQWIEAHTPERPTIPDTPLLAPTSAAEPVPAAEPEAKDVVPEPIVAPEASEAKAAASEPVVVPEPSGSEAVPAEPASTEEAKPAEAPEPAPAPEQAKPAEETPPAAAPVEAKL